MRVKNSVLDGVKLFPGGAAVTEPKPSKRKQSWPAEWNRYSDPLTGREMIQFTSSRATDQHLYFTGPSVTEKGDRLVFISDRTGNANLFCLDMLSGEIVQLTDNRFGTLRQYVFPWGTRLGLGKSSVSLNPKTGNVYYIQGRQVRRVNAYDYTEVCICEIPPGWVTAFTHVSDDDRWLCVPMVPEQAFAGSEEAPLSAGQDGFTQIEKQIQQSGLKSVLWVVATDGSSHSVRGEMQAWITHVQFRPNDSQYIVFNHEGILDTPGKQRVWMTDGKTIWKIRPEPADVKHFNCHELWTEDGSEVLYHGTGFHPKTGLWTNYYGFSDLSGTRYREFFVRPEQQKTGYGHFSRHPKSNHAYTDSYFDKSFISEVWPEEDGFVNFKPVCSHRSNWTCQDDHPHPILTPDHKLLIFSSSYGGSCNVYGARVV